ncbi:Autophagy-related protein 9 [Aphelenchoides fujianensis]|nr:Autophagy-related protein 9 [Aphelenchoides fujianensis]
MSIFSNRRSYYEPIDGNYENAAAEADGHHAENGLPPSVHRAQTEVAFPDASSRESSSELINSKREHRWDHVEDIDQFFALCYEYHQGNGFMCIALRHCVALFQFVFVVAVSTFLLQCVDYDVLFNNKNTTASGRPIVGKRHWDDAVVPNCASHFHPIIVLSLLLAVVFWIAHLFRVGYRLLQLHEIQVFFGTVLEIPDWELSNAAWKDVVEKICQKQPEVHLIVNQESITPLDVYQRILRYKNYMVALVDNDVLPLTIRVPFVGKISYLSSGLRLNLEWLLFWGPWAPWKGPYALKDEFKTGDHLEPLAENMRRTILYMGVANLVFFPFVFLYQVLFSFFAYAELVRREPGVLGSRKYSNYGRLRLRHYNELDHELNARLNKSYEYAVRYMDQFISTVAEIAAKTIAFICGSIFAILFVLSAWDEDVLNIEHVLTVMTVTAAIGLMCRSFIPNENLVFCHDFLMRQIVANVHYAPTNWIRESHSTDVCSEFGRIFQLKVQFFVEELLSPIITPFILLFRIRDKASSIVLFLHENTRSCESIGDVCAFAAMDLARDGDPRLSEVVDFTEGNAFGRRSPRKRHAKVELSLLNFVSQNPAWKPPAEAEELIKNIRELWTKDLQEANEQQPGVFAPLIENSAMLASQSTVRHQAAARPSTPPPSPTAAQQQHVQQPVGQRSLSAERSAIMSGSAGMFVESAAAAMSTSSVFSMRQSNVIHAPAARYLNRGVPDQVQENDLRALEMSMNALAVTDLLISRGSGAFTELAALGRRPSYGATAPAVPSTDKTPFRRPAAHLHDAPSGVHQSAGPNPLTSNIWGVPEESQLVDVSDGDDEDDLEHLEHQPGGADDQPPNTFNV